MNTYPPPAAPGGGGVPLPGVADPRPAAQPCGAEGI